MCSTEPSGVGRGASLIAAGTRWLTSVGSARSHPQPDLIAPRPRVARGKLRDSVDAHVEQSATFARGTRLLLKPERGGNLAGAVRSGIGSGRKRGGKMRNVEVEVGESWGSGGRGRSCAVLLITVLFQEELHGYEVSKSICHRR